MKTNLEQLRDQIIDLIKRNRISTVEVADALGKTGVIPGPEAIKIGLHVVGEVQYIYAHSESNWPVHEQGQYVRKDVILYVDAFDCGDKAIFGDLVSKYFYLYCGVKAIIINGKIRDVHTLKKEGWPIWCTGPTPLGCYNRPVELTPEIEEKANKGRDLMEGSVLIADDSGCTMIKKDLITDETKKKLEFMELQEDIWFYCLDTLKWSTYEVVCGKKYLNQPEVLPEVLRDKLKNYDL